MAAITLEPNTYTQLNTNSSSYMIQNIGSDNVSIVVSDTQPTDDEVGFVIGPREGITNSHIEGILWGKPEGKYHITVVVAEGS